MKSILVLSVSLVLASILALGQEIPRAEVYAGYSYLNIDTNDLSSRQSANGWEASVSGNFNKWFAVEGAVSGYYKNYSIDLQSLGLGTLNVKVTDYAYAGGPRINLRPIFVHALFGGDHLTGSALGFSKSQDGLAGIVGGGVQWKISTHLSVRSSADYVFTRHNIFGGSAVTQNNFRAGVGLVYSFGGAASGRTTSDQTTPRPTEENHRKARPATPHSGMTISVLGLVASARESGGAEITEVAPGSVASYAGLSIGDIINSIDGKAVRTPMELVAELSDRAPGQKIKIGYLVRGTWQTETIIMLLAKP